MTKKLSLAVAASLLLTQAANAQEEDPNAWQTHTELSYINTQGNSDTSSFALESKAKKAWDAHALRAMLAAYYSEDNGVESKNKWQTEINYDYSFSKRLSFNYLVGYIDDKFSGFDFQFYTGPGVGFKAINTKDHKLNTQANILYAIDDIEDSIDAVTLLVVNGPIERYASWKAGMDYSWQIVKSTKFTQDLTVRGSMEEAQNYFATSKTAIATKINSSLSLGVSYKVDYVNQPPADKEYTDRTFMTSLIIDY